MEQNQLDFKIKTLTPIWTGDIQRKCSYLRETSIIGSLRWWFEAIVRGLGGNVCDSTGNKKCEFSLSKYREGVAPENLICPACYIFGTTNWSRMFRVEICDDTYDLREIRLATNLPTNRDCEYRPSPENVKWWFKTTLGTINPRVFYGRDDGIALRIVPIRVLDIDRIWFIFGVIDLTLRVIEKFGSLGSHNSYGFGVIRYIPSKRINNMLRGVLRKLKDLSEERGVSNINDDTELPNLRYAFYMTFNLQNSLQNRNIGFILKYMLRRYFKKKYNKYIARLLFGSKMQEKAKFAGKIYVSNCWLEGDTVLFKVYGVLDRKTVRKISLDKIVMDIKDAIKNCLEAEEKSVFYFENYIDDVDSNTFVEFLVRCLLENE